MHWEVIFDEDHKTFSIEGLEVNENPWIEAVCRAQREGRCIRRDHAPSGLSREMVRQRAASLGYTEATQSIVTPTLDEMIGSKWTTQKSTS